MCSVPVWFPTQAEGCVMLKSHTSIVRRVCQWHVSFSSEWLWLSSQDLMKWVQTPFVNRYKHLRTARVLTWHLKCKQIILKLAPNMSLRPRTERVWSWRCNSSRNKTHIPSIIFLPPYPCSTEDFSLQICLVQQGHHSSIHATEHPIPSHPQIALSWGPIEMARITPVTRSWLLLTDFRTALYNGGSNAY